MSPEEWNAIRISVQVAFFSVLMTLPFGVGLGWLLARKNFWGKSLVEVLVNLPLVLPPVVTGYLLLIGFGRNGVLGKYLNDWFGIQFVFDWKGAALAAGIISFPLMVRAVRIAFASIDRGLEQAARTLGASPFDSFISVSVPLAIHGIIAGAVLAFARSLGEFGATIMIAGNIEGETQTIPLYIFDQLQVPGGIEMSWRIVIFSVVIAAAALVFSEWLERRSVQRIHA